jgi:hypothetical protein
MAAEPPLPADPGATPQNLRPGAALAAILLCVYGGLALSVDFPRAAIGIHSDEATYYMMGHSIAEDGDLTYHRHDLERVWREFPSGPAGLFLKRGRDVIDAGLMRRPPFVWVTSQPDPDPRRLYYGKSFIYPAFAAPFIKLFGTNGFLVFHALLLAGIAWCAYLFLHARAPAAPSAVIAGAFVMATVVPVYYVWISPEIFNFALGLFAYFCWLYKEVAPRERMPRGLRWTAGPAGDLVAAALLGIATFSKVTNALLFAPLAVWYLWTRRPVRFVTAGAVFAIAAGGLFAVNTMITGEWNYQGGDRRTFHYEFPFQTPASTFDASGMAMGRDEAQTEVILHESAFWTNFGNNLKWYFIGRYSGLVAYFFPAVFAIVLFLSGARRRPVWQWLVLAGGVAQILLFVISLPYTWFGGGGSVGNRYFIGAYGIFLFLLPPVTSIAVALVPWIVGSVFMAKLVLAPFTSSFYPGSYADAGPLRLLPVELSNVNDLPIATEWDARVVWFGDDPDRQEGTQDPGFQIYFLDKNAFREADKTFWTKGESRALFLIKTDRRMKRLTYFLTAGPVPTRVHVSLEGRSQEVDLEAGETRQITFDMGEGFPYMKTDDGLPRFVWNASVSSSAGFTPLFHDGGEDTRFLGVRVRPMLVE